MILSTSIALDDDSDTLDSLFINEVDDDDDDDFIFKDVAFFLILLPLSILAIVIIIKTSFYLL
jgi:hypothetical protein